MPSQLETPSRYKAEEWYRQHRRGFAQTSGQGEEARQDRNSDHETSDLEATGRKSQGPVPSHYVECNKSPGSPFRRPGIVPRPNLRANYGPADSGADDGDPDHETANADSAPGRHPTTRRHTGQLHGGPPTGNRSPSIGLHAVPLLRPDPRAGDVCQASSVERRARYRPATSPKIAMSGPYRSKSLRTPMIPSRITGPTGTTSAGV
jgi:hypothetical protein